ncbi:hypothetical protein ACV3UL_08080 [Clostridium perfringens]
MFDSLEKLNVHDLQMANALGIDSDEAKYISLSQMKIEMHRKAFKMREDEITITQEEADELNKKLKFIVDKLMDYDYDPMSDYLVDFDSFVKENEYYNTFAW